MVLSKHSGQKPWDTRTSEASICSNQPPLHFTLRHTQQIVRIKSPPLSVYPRNRPRGSDTLPFPSPLTFQPLHQVLHLPADAAAADNGVGDDPNGMHHR